MVTKHKVPLGIRLLPEVPSANRDLLYRAFILIFTFLCYTSYHLSRKPISIAKSVLNRNCSIPLHDKLSNISHGINDTTFCDWKPFEGKNHSDLFGYLDLAYLFSYAVAMFFSGHIAERMNLRHFLSAGMVLCGITTAAFGLGYFGNVHVLWYFIVVQIVGGAVQSTGWPSVVTCVGNWYGKGNKQTSVKMAASVKQPRFDEARIGRGLPKGNWYGKGKRGFIMGIWNSHTSVGNILGSLIAGAFVNYSWGWSFIVPGIIIGTLGILVFFFLVPEPQDVNCKLPDHIGHHNHTINVSPSPSSPEGSSQVYDSIDETSDQKSPLLRNVLSTSNNSDTSLIKKDDSEKPISFMHALKIPGVIEFALCLFFAKLVSYTFLYWLPTYINKKSNGRINAEEAADLSTPFDFGGIIGGIIAGVISDYTGARASTCALQLLLAAPMMYIYNLYGSLSLAHSIGLSLLCGVMVNGPYALITTAVSADLGTHKILQGNAKALATVTAIIDGTGSIGAAVGPLLTGLIEKSGWNNVFYMLMAADLMALLLLVRLVMKEILEYRSRNTS